MLHVTNGDSAAEGLRASGIPGEVLPWRDILHEGPVLADMDLDDMSTARARFIVEAGLGGPYEQVLQSFQERDAAMRRHADVGDEVVLWFEHDLYDQLQLAQILDWFGREKGNAARLSLICIDAFPGHPAFHGLGELRPDELATLFPVRHAVSPAEFALAHATWAAFGSWDPTALEDVLATDTSALPFLRPALLRLLEEYPSVVDGLSRTERELLQVVRAGASTPHAIYTAWQQYEEQVFMGDTPLWLHLKLLSGGPHPLVVSADGGPFRMPDEAASPQAFAAQRVRLTDAGNAVLAGHANAIALNGIDRWVGGVHLTVDGTPWRWDGARQRLARG